MAEKKKLAIFPIIPRPGEKPWQQTITAVQTHDQIANGISIPGIVRELAPRQIGGGVLAYEVRPTDDYYEQRIAAVEMKMAKVNVDGSPKRIIGPFENVAEAARAMHEERPKTNEEVVQIQGQALAQAQDENSDLKKRIAELESKLNKENK